MNEVFVDTVAWIALLDESDFLHQKAHEILDRLAAGNSRLVTTEFILLEPGDRFSAVGKREKALNFIGDLRQLEILRIISLSQQLLDQGWKLYCQRPDKNWQVTDCISFVVMKAENISIAFTADHHFEQAGFSKLM